MIVEYNHSQMVWTVRDGRRGFSIVSEVANLAYADYCKWFLNLTARGAALADPYVLTVPEVPRTFRDFLPMLAQRQWHKYAGGSPETCPMRIWFQDESKRAAPRDHKKEISAEIDGIVSRTRFFWRSDMMSPPTHTQWVDTMPKADFDRLVELARRGAK